MKTEVVRRRRGRRGFSLLEVMLCLGLLAVGLMATLAASLSTSHLQQNSRATTSAATLMNDLLERYRSVGAGAIRTHLTTSIPASPGNRLGEYVVGAPTGTWGDFTITGAVDANGVAVPTELMNARVVVTVLQEYNTDPLVTATVFNLMPVDLDGDGNVTYPADVQDLDGNGDPTNSDFTQYSVFPLRITITYPQPQVNADGSPSMATLTALTVIYPTQVE